MCCVRAHCWNTDVLEEEEEAQKEGYSPVVTHLTTKLTASCSNRADIRTADSLRIGSLIQLEASPQPVVLVFRNITTNCQA